MTRPLPGLPPPDRRGRLCSRHQAQEVGVTGTILCLVVAGATAWFALSASRSQLRRRLRARLDAHDPQTAGTPAGTGLSAPVLGLASLLGVAGVAGAWLAFGPVPVVALAALAAARPVRARLRARAAGRVARATQLPAALDGLAASLRSGASVTTALGEVGGAIPPPLGPELAALGGAAARGRPMTEVLDAWSATHDDAGTRLAATALVLATIVGSAPARAVDGVAATVRERLDLAAERRALATQARTSSLVLALAPVAFASLLVAGDTAAAEFLLGTPAGWTCLATGVGLDAVGMWWMVHLSRGESA